MDELVTITIGTVIMLMTQRRNSMRKKKKNQLGKHPQKYFLSLTSQAQGRNVKNYYRKKKK